MHLNESSFVQRPRVCGATKATPPVGPCPKPPAPRGDPNPWGFPSLQPTTPHLGAGRCGMLGMPAWGDAAALG